MFCNNTRLSFFACPKDAAGARATLKKAAPALGSGSTLEVATPAPQRWLREKINVFYCNLKAFESF